MSKAKTPVFFGTTTPAVNDENASTLKISSSKTAATAAKKTTTSSSPFVSSSAKPRTSLSNITNNILNTNSNKTNGGKSTKPSSAKPSPKPSTPTTVFQTRRQLNFTPATTTAPMSQVQIPLLDQADLDSIAPVSNTTTLTMSPPSSPRRENPLRASPYKSPHKKAANTPKKKAVAVASVLATPVKKDGAKFTYHPDFMRIINQKSEYCHLVPYPNPSSIIDDYNKATKLAQLDLSISDPELSLSSAQADAPKIKSIPSIPSIEIDLDSEEPTTASDQLPAEKIKPSSSQKSVAFDLNVNEKEEEKESVDDKVNIDADADDELGEDGMLSENEYFKYGVYSETNPRRLEMRQKQIDIGKNTPGYANYRRLVPKEKRRRGDPQTPNKHQVCSKRSWDGQIRKWRRLLHLYDPPELQSNTSSYAGSSRHCPRTPQPAKTQSKHHMYTPQPRRAPTLLFPSPYTANSQYRGYGQLATPKSPQKLTEHVSAANVSPYSTPLRV